VFVVKRLQLQQRVFDCVPRQRVFDCVPRPKPLMKAMSEVLGSTRSRLGVLRGFCPFLFFSLPLFVVPAARFGGEESAGEENGQ
jgi:hypothetical protein